MNALVVDDSSAMRAILARMLRALDFEVKEAEDGRAALDVLASSGPFDLALVDWNMPVMDGLQLLHAMRSDRRLDGMRVMMVTTETEIDRVACALDAGASEYLMKPFTTEAMAEKLAILGLVDVP